MDSFSLVAICDEERLISVLPYLNQAMDDGLFSYEEAEQLLVDECISFEVEDA